MVQLSSERARVGRVEGHDVTISLSNGHGNDTEPLVTVILFPWGARMS